MNNPRTRKKRHPAKVYNVSANKLRHRRER